MNPYDSHEKLDSLQGKLDSRAHPMHQEDTRTELSSQPIEAPGQWKDDDDIRELVRAARERKEADQGAVFKKILIGSVIFCVVAVSVGAALFFGGQNRISADLVDMKIAGPSSIAAGQELALEAVIENKNRVPLESVVLTVTYPDGTRVPGSLAQELTRTREQLDTVLARSESRRTASAVLFGEKDTVQEIVFTVEFRLEGGSALFTREKRYEIGITSAPLIVTIENPQEINANQRFDFAVDISSNTAETLEGVIFKAEYPSGFRFESADPQPSAGNTQWQLGTIKTGDKKRIVISGTLDAQNEEERTFRFTTGLGKPDDEETIGAAFSAIARSITVRRPFLSLDLKALGRTADGAVKPGESAQVSLTWKNNLPVKLLDVRAEAVVEGDTLNESTVKVASGGFYRSLDNTAFWDKTTDPKLSVMEPGQTGVASFSFSSVGNVSPLGGSKQITVTVKVAGTQVTDTGKQERIEVVGTRVIRLSTVPRFTSETLRSVGPFENEGPVPPRADTETTYTVRWRMENGQNTVTGGTARAVLPPYVTWKGNVSPSSESVTFNPITREVIWDLGDTLAGAGRGAPEKVAFFQVGIVPSLSQVGSDPVLVEGVSYVGTDRFTREPVRLSASSVSIRYSADPTYRDADDRVAP